MRQTIIAAGIAVLFVTSALAAGDTGIGKGKASPPAEGPPPPKAMAPAPVISGILVVHHHVADYAKWRPVFDGDKANQETVGLTNPHVYMGKNANDVYITFDMADEAKAKGRATSKELRETMKNAGVMGKPDVMYLTPEK
jgi:hypothetical protein